METDNRIEQVKHSLLGELRCTFFIKYTLDGDDCDDQTVRLLEKVIDTHLSKLRNYDNND